MSAEAVKKLSFEIAPSEEESEATIEQQDVACGLENLPVSLWPLGAGPRPKPFQYTPDHVAGPGADMDPTQITFPGCACIKTPCVPGTCSCLRHESNYNDNLCLRDVGSEAKYAKPVFECNVLCQCGEHCRNRVVQSGLQFLLQVFQTEKKRLGTSDLGIYTQGKIRL